MFVGVLLIYNIQICAFVSGSQWIYIISQNNLPAVMSISKGWGELGLRERKQRVNEMFILHSRWHKPHYHIIAQMSSLASSFMGLYLAAV